MAMLCFFVLGSFFGFYLKGWTESSIRTNTVESDTAIILKLVGSDALVIVHVEQLGPGLGDEGYASDEAMVEKGSESDLISRGYKRVAKDDLKGLVAPTAHGVLVWTDYAFQKQIGKEYVTVIPMKLEGADNIYYIIVSLSGHLYSQLLDGGGKL